MPEAVPLSTPLAWALRYAEIGWHVFPCEARSKVPMGKLVPRGQLDATTDQQRIREWWTRAPHANIGVFLAASGLVAIDIDPRNGGTETFDALQAEHGSLRSDVMAFTGGGGEHHVFVVPSGAQVSLPGKLGPGVDVKANGYIIVEPSVHPSGTAYGWEASSSPLDGIAPSPLPDWLRNMKAPAPASDPGSAERSAVAVDPATARDAREALYVISAEEREEWLSAGMALHSTGWGEPAYAMWCAWSQQSSKFDAAVQRKTWESFKARADGIKLSWLFAEAARHGWVNPAARLRPAPDPTDGPPPEWDEIPLEGAAAPEQEQAAPKLPILSLAELRDRAGAAQWLVKGVVPAAAVGMLFGASGTFKSFLALDMALHCAHGMKWLGRKTQRTSVLYIAAEGGTGLWRRVQAWHQEHGLVWDEIDFWVLPVSVDLGQQSGVVIEAAQALGVAPGLVIVDTLSQTYTGEENSANEVAGYLGQLGAWFRDKWSASVLVIHHNGHSATERPRGSSALRSNVDFMFGAFREEKEMLATLVCVKQKDATLFDDQAFALSVREVDRDEDGDPVTALVARAVLSDEEKAQLVSHEASAGRSGRNALLLTLATSGMTEHELRKAFYEDCGIANTEAQRKAYYRALGWAKSAGLIEIVQGRVIVTKGSAA